MNWFEQAKSLAKQAAELAEIAAFETQIHARDFLKTRGGVPGVVTSVAGLGCAAVAAVGTANLTLEVASKFYAPKDCKRCNGWEGVQCTTCFGSGLVKFHVRSSGLDRSEETPEKVAEAVREGRADVVDLPPNVDFGIPLPSRSCPRCDGTGVVKCPVCEGCANKLDRISFDQLFGAPKMSWKLYDTNRPVRPEGESLVHPDMARVMLFDVPEAELGEKFADADKDAVFLKYKTAYQYDWARQAVINQAPGWIEAQQLMEKLDPERAATDTAIVRDAPLHFARKQLISEIFQLPAPPRPDDWKLPGVEEAMRKELAKVPAGLRVEAERIVNERQQMLDQMLDEQWANAWHTQKLDEKLKSKMGNGEDSQREFTGLVSSAGAGAPKEEVPKPEKTAATSEAMKVKVGGTGSGSVDATQVVKKKKKKAAGAGSRRTD